MKSEDLVVDLDESLALRFFRKRNPLAKHFSLGLALDHGDEQLEIHLDADDVARLKLWLAEHYTDQMN